MPESLAELMARRAQEQEARPRIAIDARVRTKAWISLAVGVLAIGGFLYGLRRAMERIPPPPTEATADSLRQARLEQQRRGPGGGGPEPAYAPQPGSREARTLDGRLPDGAPFGATPQAPARQAPTPR